MKSMALLGQKRFLPYFITQFLGAFNDNVYKNGITIFILYQAQGVSEQSGQLMITIASGLFILPFFLFSARAGVIADHHEQSALIRRIKLFEIFIMLSAVIAFALQSITLMIVILFLMGTQSTFFGPVKYSLLPKVLEKNELMPGNALVESGTFLSILLGLIVGVMLVSGSDQGLWYLAAGVISFAILGYLSSRFIPQVPFNPKQEAPRHSFMLTWALLKQFADDKKLFFTLLHISWFWFLGIVYVTQLPVFVRFQMHASEQVYLLMLASFSVGIALGSLLCEKLARMANPLLWVVIAVVGITLFGFDLSMIELTAGEEELGVLQVFQQTQAVHAVVAVLMIGFFGGIYSVPLYTRVQVMSDQAVLGKVFAVNNILNALFMVLATVFSVAIISMGYGVKEIFLLLSLLNIAVCGWLFWRQEDFRRLFV